MKLLENKVAIITGASRGIGKGIAQKFAEQGASIAFTYVSSEDKANALEVELSEMGVKAKGYKSNAGDFNAAQELINAIVSDFSKIDIEVKILTNPDLKIHSNAFFKKNKLNFNSLSKNIFSEIL